MLGGAAVIDVKEPRRGPLGMADPAVWRAVRLAVPADRPVSVALGELRDWRDGRPLPAADLDGIAYRKIGPSGLGLDDWRRGWDELRDRSGPGPAWVAVAYLDDREAGAPPPEAIRDAALDLPECAGLLLDTWTKGRPGPPMDPDAIARLIEPVRRSGRFAAIAGGLDADRIGRLAAIGPDLFAVRGAACDGGDRESAVDAGRVRSLVAAIEGGSQIRHDLIAPARFDR